MEKNGMTITDWVGALDEQKPYYLAVIDCEGQMSFTNSRFFTSFQTAGSSGIQSKFFNLVHESDRQQLNETLATCSMQDNAVTTEIRVKNGHFRWVKWDISRVRKPENMSEKYLCLGYDIPVEDQQKKTLQVFERNYQTSNALFHSFMDHTPRFTWIMDEEENLLFANKSLLEYFQQDASAFGKSLYSIIPVQIADFFHEKHNMVLNCNRSEQSIVKSLMADGREHVYQVIVFPIHGKGPGMMVGGEALDITDAYQARKEEKKATERLLELTKSTSEEIRNLEAQLTRQKFKEQKEVAEAIIRAQEEERGRIGHELHDNVNQILSSGQLYLSLLNPGADDFDEIKDKTMEILQLGIEEIRQLSRAMVMPDLKAGGLLASIKELVEDLRFAKVFNISLVHSTMADIESISQSKKVTLYRIFQEQIKNIVKYSQAKNVEISLYFGNDYVRLSIKDDGIGFDSKNTRRGLGLSNIYERTRLYHGKVMLTTAPGKGCSIVINLPVSECPRAAAQAN